MKLAIFGFFVNVLPWIFIFGAVPLTIYLLWKQCGGFVSC